ncbi:MAG: S-layer homology domain-containing protein [Candidatus Gracilibacteria bacterium]
MFYTKTKKVSTLFLLSAFIFGFILNSELVFAANVAPVASDVSITGGTNVGDLLTGNYTFSDADNDWTALGGAGNAYNGETWRPKMKVDQSGNVYFAFGSDIPNGNKGTVTKYDPNTQSWSFVGTPYFTPGAARDVGLDIDSNGTPYFAFQDEANFYRPSVMKFNGTSWVYVGLPEVSNVPINSQLNLVLDSNDLPYISYVNDTNFKLKVLRFNGTSWVDVGPAGEPSTDAARGGSLALDGNNVPYITYAIAPSAANGYNYGKVIVKKFNGTSWIDVGPAGGVSEETATDVTMAIDSNNVPYFVYSNTTGGNKALKFNGSVWEYIGSNSGSVTPVFGASSPYLALDDNDVPYVALEVVDFNDGTYSNSVRKFNGTSWETVGSDSFTPARGYIPVLDFDADQNVYIGFEDFYFSDPDNDVVSYGTVTKYAIVDEEGASTYRWLRDGTPISGATASTYTIVTADRGTTLTFEVTPVAATGTSPGTAATSPAYFIPDEPPEASNVSITGNPRTGELLTGEYTYSDPDGNPEGNTTFQWFKDDTPISDATTTTYTVKPSDVGHNIAFEVRPVASAGITNGTPVRSVNVMILNAPPMASNVSISGNPYAGEVLTGQYTFSDADSNIWKSVNNNGDASLGTNAQSAFLRNDAAGKLYMGYVDQNFLGTVTTYNTVTETWEYVGSPAFTNSNVYMSAFDVSETGTPYYAFMDESVNYQATVMKYNGSSWVHVGALGFTPDPVNNIYIDIDSNNTPYIAYSSQLDASIYVMKYNGTSWVQVGTSPASASNASFALDHDGTPYIAYLDNNHLDSNFNPKTTVKKFNGTAWVTVGTEGFSQNGATYTSITFDSQNQPYLTYDDVDLYKTITQKFNGTAWETVGQPTGVAYSNALISIDANDVPYVVYSNYANQSSLNIISFNGTSWVPVGDTVISDQTAANPTIAFGPNNKLYTGYVDYSTMDSAATVKTLDAGDIEGASEYAWLKDSSPISGETGVTYTVKAEDIGHTIIFQVSPRSATGTNPGTTQSSSGLVILNSTPTAPSDLYANTAANGAQTGLTNPTITSADIVLSAIYNDPDMGDTANKYDIQIGTDTTFTALYYASGMADISDIAQGERSPDIVLNGFNAADNLTYYWRIKFWDVNGEEGAYSQAAEFTTVLNDIPTSPTDLYANTAANGAQTGLTNPTLNDENIVFSAVYNDNDPTDTAKKYQLQVSTDITFSTTDYDSGSGVVITDISTGERSIDIAPGSFTADDNTPYYWRIKFWDANDAEGPYSGTASFLTKINDTPSAPIDLFSNTASEGAQSGLSNPTLAENEIVFSAIYTDEDATDTANKYQLEISSDSSFNTIVYDSGSTGTSIADISEGDRSTDIIPGLFTAEDDSTYYWRIKFWDDENTEGAFSSAASFTTNINDAPTAPTDLFANDSTTGAQSGLTDPTTLQTRSLAFSAVFNDPDTNDTSTQYQLQISATNTFSSTVYDSGAESIASIDAGERSSDITTTFTPEYETTYYWRIRFWDAETTAGAYSSAATFSVPDQDAPVVTSTTPADGATNVSTSTEVKLSITDLLSEVDLDSLDISIGGSNAITDGVCEQNNFNCSTNPITNGYEIVITNTSGGYAANTQHTVAYSVQDTAATPNVLSDDFSFTTLAAPDAPSDLYANISSTGVQSGLANPMDLNGQSVAVSAVHNDPQTEAAESYRLEVSTDNGFSTIIFDSGKTQLTSSVADGARSPSITIPETLVDNTTYYWRIRFWSNAGEGTPATASFGIHLNSAPTAPTNLFANDASSGAQTGLTNPTDLNSTSLTFSGIYNDPDTGDIANKYQLQISTDNNFSAIAYDSGSTGTSITNIIAGNRSEDIILGTSFTPVRGTTYYYRIKFWDDSNTEGAFSASGTSSATFKVKLANTPTPTPPVSGGGGGGGYTPPAPVGTNTNTNVPSTNANNNSTNTNSNTTPNNNTNTTSPNQNSTNPNTSGSGGTTQTPETSHSLCKIMRPFDTTISDAITESELKGTMERLLKKGVVLNDQESVFDIYSEVDRGTLVRYILQSNCETYPVLPLFKAPFIDVPVTNTNALFISIAKAYGKIKGYEVDGTFRPGNKITRAEALKIILEITLGDGERKLTGTASPYNDVPADAWFKDYVSYAFEHGIIKPLEDKKFRPNDAAKKSEIFYMLGRVFAFKNS